MAQVGGLGLSLNLGGGGAEAIDIEFTPVDDITATNVQDAIEQLYDLSTWQHSANVPLSGSAAVDITGIPATANEISFTANGASGSTTSVFFVQIITSLGVQAASYFTGQTTNSASSSAYANTNPGTNIPLTPSVANTVFLGGQGVFRRVNGTGSWGFTFTGFSTVSMYTTTVLVSAAGGGDILGVRFGVSAGTFDNGSMALSWRS